MTPFSAVVQTLSLAVVLSSWMLAVDSPSAAALPGQSLAQLKAWAKATPGISKLEHHPYPDEGEYDYYSPSVEGATFSFNVGIYLDDRKCSRREKIRYFSKHRLMPFERTDPFANDLLARLYGRAISGDFSQSRFIAREYDPHAKQAKCLYQGKRFIYETIESREPWDGEYLWEIAVSRMSDLPSLVKAYNEPDQPSRYGD